MWEEQMPTVVAPVDFQAHQRFIALAASKLSRSFEPALILPARGFHRAAALRFPGGRRGRIVQPG